MSVCMDRYTVDKEASASGGLPIGLRPWTPQGDFRHPYHLLCPQPWQIDAYVNNGLLYVPAKGFWLQLSRPTPQFYFNQSNKVYIIGLSILKIQHVYNTRFL